MARQTSTPLGIDDARAARVALQDYLAVWARGLTVIVGGRPRKLTAAEVQRVAMQAQPRPVRRGPRLASRPADVF